jgi:hypothetical protein
MLENPSIGYSEKTLEPPAIPSLAAPSEELQAFRRLQQRLLPVWEGIHGRVPWEHTSVVVPSISFNQEELAKIRGVPFYEERMLFTLMRLRHPACRVLYVTSQPIHPDIVDYYLHLLVGVPSNRAWKRLSFLCVYDASPKALTQKILERPRLIERIRSWVGNRRRAYLTCFNSTELERHLAVALDVPLNGLDPSLLHLGTKSGAREIFRRAGVDSPEGFENLRSREDFAEALVELSRRRPGLKKALLKLNDGFSGEGNALFTYPELTGGQRARDAIDAALEELAWNAEDETTSDYFRKLEEMGGIVEEFIEAEEVRSPSVQMRIHPTGDIALVSTHDQVLGGKMGQAYVGCRFPASDEYRGELVKEAAKIARVLAEEGVVSRFGIDFLAFRDADEEWRLSALEINLRMGGTTHSFQALQFLTSGDLDARTGLFVAPDGRHKFYFSTDGLTSPSYRGLLAEDLFDILSCHGLHFQPAPQKGVLFHMIGALSEYGKVGVTCIGDSREAADHLYRCTVDVLDRETGATGSRRGSLQDPFYERRLDME